MTHRSGGGPVGPPRWTDRYFDLLSARLAEVKECERAAMAQAAAALAETLAGDGLIYVFSTGHSTALMMDIFYRAGGLILVQPIFDERVLLHHVPVTETSEWERKEGWAAEAFQRSGAHVGDAMIVISTSGRNAAPVDAALAAKEAGVKVIALTGRAYAATLTSRHSSGKRLHEVADIVVDTHADPGDAAVEVPGLAQKVAPMSTAIGSAILQAVILQAIANLVEQGVTPPVFMSANYPGGDEHNQAVLARYRDRIRYLGGGPTGPPSLLGGGPAGPTRIR